MTNPNDADKGISEPIENLRQVALSEAIHSAGPAPVIDGTNDFALVRRAQHFLNFLAQAQPIVSDGSRVNVPVDINITYPTQLERPAVGISVAPSPPMPEPGS